MTSTSEITEADTGRVADVDVLEFVRVELAEERTHEETPCDDDVPGESSAVVVDRIDRIDAAEIPVVVEIDARLGGLTTNLDHRIEVDLVGIAGSHRRPETHLRRPEVDFTEISFDDLE